MADKKLTQLDALASCNYLDLTYVIDDPSGTPVSKKATLQNAVKGGASEGAVSALIDANLTASRAVKVDSNGKIVISAVTDTELEYLDGVTSAIQTQLNAKQATITGAATTIDTED
jgi:hypothetical protein